MEDKRYQPVYQMKSGKKDIMGNFACFTVNGAISHDYDEAVRLGNKHSSVRSGEAVLIRVNVLED